MLYLALKWLHVLGVVVFLGTGAGSAWYKLRADRSGDPHVVVWCQREVVRADWFFTIPSGVIVPLTGLALVHLGPWTFEMLWVQLGLAFYLVAGLTWAPAAMLQVRMRRLAEEALSSGQPLPERFHQDNRIWFALGLPSFLAAIGAVWVMVAKHV